MLINNGIVSGMDSAYVWKAMGNMWKVWRGVWNKSTLPATSVR